MCCGVTRGRQEAIDEVMAILLNEFGVGSGRIREADRRDGAIGFP